MNAYIIADVASMADKLLDALEGCGHEAALDVDEADVAIVVLPCLEVAHEVQRAIEQDLPVLVYIPHPSSLGADPNPLLRHRHVCHVYRRDSIADKDIPVGVNAVYVADLKQLPTLLGQWKASVEAGWRLRR